MQPVVGSCLCAFTSIMMLSQDDSLWRNKPIPQWDNQDARQVLDNSPWVKKVKLDKVRDLSKFERRDGGDWEAGIGPTVDFGETGLLGPFYKAIARERARQRGEFGSVMVRWESTPVREAELRVGDTGAPMWTGDFYAIGVYDISAPHRWNLANELKGIAFLKRPMKKDVKPERVLISYHIDGNATIVYLFPHSADIDRQDSVQFVAQIGRLFVSQLFEPREMEFEGKPEL